MANFTSAEDLKLAVLQHAGEVTNGNSPFDALVMTYLNRVYHEIISGGNTFKVDLGEPWPWAKEQNPGILTLVPPYDTGTITLTKGSTSGTFSSAPAISLANYYLKVDERPEVFRIAAHSAASTSFTLDGEYTDDSGAGLNYELIKLRYTLGTSLKIQRLIEPMRVYRSQAYDGDQEGKIYSMDFVELTKRYPVHALDSGTPTQFSIIGELDNELTVQFNRSVTTETRVEYEYIPVPANLTDSAASIPLLPREDRIVLVFGATYWLMLDKEDSRAALHFRNTQSKLQAMVQARRKELSQSSKNFGKLQPRQEQVVRSRLRTTSGLTIL